MRTGFSQYGISIDDLRVGLNFGRMSEQNIEFVNLKNQEAGIVLNGRIMAERKPVTKARRAKQADSAELGSQPDET